MTETSPIIKQLAIRRRVLGYTKSYVARQTHMSKYTLQIRETGQFPGLTALELWAKVLGYRVELIPYEKDQKEDPFASH